MKKGNVLFLFLIFVFSIKAQLPVSTLPQNKKVIIEHFTAINCGYSPHGDMLATQIYTADPTKVVLIQIHNGSYSTPTVAGQPSFTTSYGNIIGTMPGLNMVGWPAAAINRTVMSAYSQNTATPGMAQSRTYWASAAGIIKSQSAYCNVALQGTVDVNTRVLSVEAEVYYTANSPVSTNSLHIVLLEDSIHGPIQNWGFWNLNNYNPDSSYNHNNVLRAGLTPSFGLTIPNTTAGTTFSTTASYTIPLTYGPLTYTTICMLGRLKLAAFVTETHSITINGTRGPVLLTGFNNTLDIGTNFIKSDPTVCSGTNFGSSIKFINYGSTPVNSAVFSYGMNGATPATYTWNGFPVGPYQLSQTINLPVFNFSPLTTNTLDVGVAAVNSAADQNNLNDVSTRTVNITTLTATNVNMTMYFNQDKYGSEVEWIIYDESTWLPVPGASVAVGTYSDLVSSGVQLHIHNFVVNPSNCYKLVVTDKFGDGVNAGFGVGGYTITHGTSTLIAANGAYGKGESRWYKTSITAGINVDETPLSEINVFPNPATTNALLEIDLLQNETLSVSVINALGQEVFSSVSGEYNAGKSTININTTRWSAGVYNINVSSPKGIVNRKLVVE